MALPESLCVVLFDSTSAALRAEKITKAAGIEVKLIPVPRHLSSDCGVCLRYPASRQETVAHLLADAGLETAGMFPATP